MFDDNLLNPIRGVAHFMPLLVWDSNFEIRP
jgi:hypothetical protein